MLVLVLVSTAFTLYLPQAGKGRGEAGSVTLSPVLTSVVCTDSQNYCTDMASLSLYLSILQSSEQHRWREVHIAWWVDTGHWSGQT